MNLDELQSIQSRERQATSLQELRPTFYQDAGEFIRELVRERDRAAERADDPFSSPEVRRLTDDIETAKSTVEALYERRIGKVVKTASIAAAGMPANDDGLTEEEQELFDTLVDRIEQNRKRVLDGVIDGDGSDISCARGASPPDPDSEPTPDSREPMPDQSAKSSADAPASVPEPDSEPIETTVDSEPGAAADLGLEPAPDSDAGAGGGETDGVSAADMMGTGGGDDSISSGTAGDVTDEAASVPADAAAGDVSPSSEDAGAHDPTTSEPAPDTVERTTVRITRDVGEVFGVDERSYELSSDDVVTLPTENAGPLVERDAAERLE